MIILTTGIWRRSWSSLCRDQYIYVSFAFVLGIVGTNSGIFIPQSSKNSLAPWFFISHLLYLCLIFVGKDVPYWFWLSWLLLPPIQWIQKAEGKLFFAGTILPHGIWVWIVIVVILPCTTSSCILEIWQFALRSSRKRSLTPLVRYSL